MIGINATDMIHGTRLAFGQDVFDFICSDLATFPVARACAASSAVPLLLTPITLKNYAGSCGFQMPASLEASLETGICRTGGLTWPTISPPSWTRRKSLTCIWWTVEWRTTSVCGPCWKG